MEELREMFGDYPELMLREALEATGSLDGAVEILLQIQMPARIGAGAPPPEPPPLPQPQAQVAQVQVPLLDDPMAMDLDEDHARGFAGLEIQDVEPLGEEEAVLQVVNIFPDVCTEHVKKLYHDNVALQAGNIVEYIITAVLEKGPAYPRGEAHNPRKRKRHEDLLEQKKYEAKDRPKPPDGYFPIA